MKHPSNMSFIIFKKKISSACKYLFTLNVSIARRKYIRGTANYHVFGTCSRFRPFMAQK